MADAIGSYSYYGQSDELVDPYCDPCFNKDGVTHQAVSYCSKCIEFYCKSCLESHDKFAFTKQQKILRASDMLSSQADKSIKYCLCEHHDKRMDQYSLDHRVLLCTNCVIRNHRCEINQSKQCQNILIFPPRKRHLVVT